MFPNKAITAKISAIISGRPSAEKQKTAFIFGAKMDVFRPFEKGSHRLHP